MKFHLDTAEIYVPDEEPVEQALARTTHLCLAAHQDDIEIMAAQPILDLVLANHIDPTKYGELIRAGAVVPWTAGTPDHAQDRQVIP